MQFAYCPLIWIIHSIRIQINDNKRHERALIIFYKEHFSSFEELLSKGKSVTVHERNLLTLVIEMYKILNSLSPEIMKEILKLKLL